MADFSATWAWLGSLGGLSQEPGRLLVLHPASFLEGEHGEALGCLGCVGPPALERPRLKWLLVLHSC